MKTFKPFKPFSHRPSSMQPEDLLEWRRRHKLSREEGATALGLSAASIKRYEGGSRTIPRIVELLCAAYDMGFKGIDYY